MEYNVKSLLSEHLYKDILGILHGQINFDCFKNKTVLITGGGKLAGYYLACAFLIGNDIDGNNTKVIVTDKEESLFEKYGNLNSRTDIDFIISKNYSNLPREKSDYIIHTDTIIDKDYFEAIENLLNYAQLSPDTSVVLCTNAEVYGSVYNGKSKLSEEDTGYINLAYPDNYNLQVQRMVELYGKKIAVENNSNIKMARMCGLLGALKLSSNPLNKFITAALTNAKNADNMHLITEDGNIIKSYCYVTDAVTALLKILTNGENGQIYNISTGCDTSFNYIIEICQQLFPDLNANVAYKGKNISNDYNVSPMSSTREILDNSKLLKLGFVPEVSLAESIKRTVKIIEENI